MYQHRQTLFTVAIERLRPTFEKMPPEIENDKQLAKNYLYLTSLISGGMAGLVVDVVLFVCMFLYSKYQCQND